MILSDLCGEHILSGIERGHVERPYGWETQDCNYIKFCLDGVNYMAVENPDDGYRSYLDELETTDDPCEIKLPEATVYGQMEERNQWGERMAILDLIDSITHKVVLRVGTGNCDDYYPYCVQEWIPENLACNQRIMGHVNLEHFLRI